jgi:hypothetical protein
MAQFVSKIQVKNFVAKNFGKSSVSQSRKGKICYQSSSGFKFEEVGDGFVRVWYFNRNFSFANRERDAVVKVEKFEAVKEVLVAAGFEFNGEGFRKERA